MDNFKLTEKDIETRVGERSFQRGLKYFHGGAIFNGRKQGMMLKALCEGSRPEPYRVQATVGTKGIDEAKCSCPVGSGGFCKHVAALLLTWLARPEDFREVEDVDKALEKRSRTELIALIKQMLRVQPDFESLLEVSLPAPGKRRMKVDAEAYKRQAMAAFRHINYGWGVERSIADELLGMKEVGDGFTKQKDYVSAAAVYGAVCAAIMANDEMLNDDEGELGSVVQECVTELGKCLAAERDSAVRESILQTLFDVYRVDVELGGIDLGYEVPEIAMKHATAEERQLLVGWIRKELPSADRDWGCQEYGSFLLQLQKETLDDEAFLQICRDTGCTEKLVDRLLKRRRLDEAIKEAESSKDYDLLQLADIFVRHRQAEAAERLIAERSKKTKDTRILEWLKKRAYTKKDSRAALELVVKIFFMMPGLAGYQEARKLAQQLGRWEELRTQLLFFLKGKVYRGILTSIYLDEKDIDKAFEAVKTEDDDDFYGYRHSMRLQVAKAAEVTRPRAALEIYRQHAESLIRAQGRENYREACRFLKRVRALHEKLGENGAWAAYIMKLRENNGKLRAFMEELTAADL